jgi:hypothetical protein
MAPPYFLQTNQTLLVSGDRGTANCIYAFGFYWFFNFENAVNSVRCYKIHPRLGLIVSTAVRVTGGVAAGSFLYTGANAVYVVASFRRSDGNTYLLRIDPSNFPGGGITQSATFGILGTGNPYHVATTPDGHIWTNFNSVRRIDPVLLVVVATVAGTLGVGGGICYDNINGFIWATGGTGNPTVIWKIDPATNAVVDNITLLGSTFNDICFAFGSLWVGFSVGNIKRYNPVTKALIADIPIQIGAGASQIDNDKGFIAIVNNIGPPPQLQIIDPRNNTTIQTGTYGARVTLYPAAEGSPGGVSGNKDNRGFLQTNQSNYFGLADYGYAFVEGQPDAKNIYLGTKPKTRYK